MKAAAIGGGPAGCTAAYTLRKQGHEVVLFESQDHVGGRTSQVRREGFNLGSGALFLMGGIYPRTNAILKELGRDDELVPWDAKTQVIDDDGTRYNATFDQAVSFVGMSVLSLRDKLRIAAGVATKFLLPGPTSCFDGAELAKHDPGENLESWSRRVLGDRGRNYITEPYMGFLYAVPMSWLSPALFHAVIKQFHKLSLSVPPGGVGQVSEWLVEGTPGLDLRLSTAAESITAIDDGYTVLAGGEVHEVDAVVVAPEPGVPPTSSTASSPPRRPRSCATACTRTTPTCRSATSATPGRASQPASPCRPAPRGTGAPACCRARGTRARSPTGARRSGSTSTPRRWPA